MNEISQKITIIDGISIICIVLFHEMGGLNRPDSIFVLKYLATLGLILFTFSSGLKLGLNHSTEINEKIFLKTYFVKRFARLYKAYIGYTILAFFPLFIISYISINYLNIHFGGITDFWSDLNLTGLWATLIGNNIVSAQLWYLIALIIMTAMCFLIIYASSINLLFYFIIPLILFDLLCFDFLEGYSVIWFRCLTYLPAFIFGIWYGYKKPSKKLVYITPFLVLFCASLYYPIIYKYSILLFGVTFPAFMIQVSDSILKGRIVKIPLTICGIYSFSIYLFHWPIILPVLNRTIVTIFKFDYIISPYVITVVAIIICIYVYKISKYFKINKIFE